ncbi:hypothetical protein J6590_013889 [Homalodisca vitripennis]|nr:hypothetical protein J6590_013889 [Homalodisca vitripennis]
MTSDTGDKLRRVIAASNVQGWTLTPVFPELAGHGGIYLGKECYRSLKLQMQLEHAVCFMQMVVEVPHPYHSPNLSCRVHRCYRSLKLQMQLEHAVCFMQVVVEAPHPYLRSSTVSTH